MLDLLETSKVWFGDGIFSTVNHHILVSQIYMILVETPKGIIIPAAWFLLPNKKKTYQMMLQSNEEKIPGPKILHVNFEIGVVKACNVIFPEARILYCHFHWMQTLKRNIGSHGLHTAKNQDAAVQLYIRSLLGEVSFGGNVFLVELSFGGTVFWGKLVPVI